MSSYLISGVLAGVAGLLVFLVIHHFWIRPIWFIFPIGLLIAALGGLAVGWSYYEIEAGLPAPPLAVLAVSALIALILAPSIVIAQLRPPLIDAATLSFAPGDGPRIALHYLFELFLTAVLVGATAGWFLGHSSRAVISTAIAGVAFALGPGHNIPALGGTPAAGKGILLLAAITFIASIVLVEGVAYLARK